MIIALTFFLVFAVGGCALAIGLIYNQLVRRRILVREAFSGIDVQLKRRHELIPNLVRTVAAYSQHERETLSEVTSKRTLAIQALEPTTRLASEQALSSALGNLLVISEQVPQLRADQHYLELMQQLSAIEDDLQKSRRYYNGTVRELNTLVESFPANLCAALFGFHIEGFFTLERLSESQVPSVHIPPTP